MEGWVLLVSRKRIWYRAEAPGMCWVRKLRRFVPWDDPVAAGKSRSSSFWTNSWKRAQRVLLHCQPGATCERLMTVRGKRPKRWRLKKWTML